jgi:type II secretory pathway component GspD/PulD (secretin)
VGARLLLAVLVLTATAVCPRSGAGEERRVSEVHPLGIADVRVAHEVVLGLLSAEGRAVLDEGHNTVIVLDSPGRQEAVRDALRGLQLPLPSVRVETRITDRETGGAAELSASGQLVAYLPDGSAEGSVFFTVDDKKTSRSRKAEQLVVVSSGGEASISVGRQIPYPGWFAVYGSRLGLVAADIDWKEVGSRLAVRPTVIDGGKKVRLQVVPELDYLVGGTGRKKGKRREISFVGEATEVVTASGEEMRIGGNEESEEFYSRLLVGYDRQRRVRSVDVFVRATVLDGSGRPSSP